MAYCERRMAALGAHRLAIHRRKTPTGKRIVMLRRARTAIYVLTAALLLAQAFWESSGTRSSDDDVEISAARRMPRTATVEDAIY
jgi:hypothetical protein